MVVHTRRRLQNHSLAPLLLTASGSYSIGGRCLSSNFFKLLLLLSYSFCLNLTKLGTPVLYANIEKTVEQIFEMLL